MSKDEYREYFRSWQKYLKLSVIVEEIGISKSNFSLFMSNNNGVMSITKLEKIKQHIDSCVNNTSKMLDKYDFKDEK